MDDDNTTAHDVPLWPPFPEHERFEAEQVTPPREPFSRLAAVFTGLIFAAAGLAILGVIGLAWNFARSAWGW